MNNNLHIVAGSDFHGLLVKPEEMPSGDVLCICGDIVPLDYQNSTIKSVSWFLLDFVPWVDSLPYKKVILIGGNHDFFLQDIHRRPSQMSDEFPDLEGFTWRSPSEVMKHLLVGSHKGTHNKLVYLCDNSYEYEGFRFYGTPWIADLSKWAFYKDEDNLKQYYERIPKICDVILTHMPANVADMGTVLQNGTFNSFSNYGSNTLADSLSTRSFKYALCGHVHSGNHKPFTDNQGRTYVNVSIKDENYKRNYNFFEFDIEK